MGAYDKMKRFLDRKGLSYEEGRTDEGERFFRLRQPVDNSETLMVVISFNQDDKKARAIVFKLATVSDSSKFLDLLEILNDLNNKISYWRFATSSEGEVTADYELHIEDDFDCEQIFFPIQLLVYGIIKNGIMKPVMRLQWS